jgi:hypothetical protein
MIRIVCDIKGCTESEAEARLENSNWCIREAVK